MKDRFRRLLINIDREGMEDLLAWLETTDFYTAPASTKHHGAVEGGLLEHSLAVYDNLCRVADTFFDDRCPGDFVIPALLHDICKADFYTVSSRNVKNEQTGQWEKQPYYAIEDQMPLGHGEKSVILIQRFIRPSLEETMAIRWHMGAWGAVEYGERQALDAAMKKYPLILALQMADQAATYFDRK